MGKTKNKEGSEIRFLQGENRRLKKIIRSLESEIKALKKWSNISESQDEEIDQTVEDTFVNLIKCDGEDGCGKGVFQEMHILDKVYGTCNVCNRRKRLK